MWFIFPQLKGLGRSETARFYGLDDLAAARAYLGDPVLGARLRECVATVLRVEGKLAHDIFGSPDDLKFCSSVTLFEGASEAETDRALFSAALDTFYQGRRDPLTVELLGQGGAP